MIPETEREMVLSAEDYLNSEQIAYAIEVPFLHRSIDLVYQLRDELIAVEFKRHDWKRALQQAEDHILGAEKVYICMPKARITDAIKSRAEDIGVGVFAWSGEQPFEEVVPATTSPLLWHVSQAWLRERFEFRRDQAPEED